MRPWDWVQKILNQFKLRGLDCSYKSLGIIKGIQMLPPSSHFSYVKSVFKHLNVHSLELPILFCLHYCLTYTIVILPLNAEHQITTNLFSILPRLVLELYPNLHPLKINWIILCQIKPTIDLNHQWLDSLVFLIMLHRHNGSSKWQIPGSWIAATLQYLLNPCY